jgi:hypothetical protein
MGLCSCLRRISVAIQYRRSRDEDYDAIAALAKANFVDNLTPEQRRDGFLSVRLAREDFLRMANEVAVVVGIEDGILAGFLCGEWIDKSAMPPLLDLAARTFQGAQFRGKPGREWKAFLEGPLCIAAGHRGEGMRHGLHKALMDAVRGRYEVGVSFIAFDNPRSYHGATAHGGFEEVASFDLNGRLHHILAFPVD